MASPLSHPPHAHAAALPPVDARPRALGTPQAGALATGYCSAPNIAALAARDRAPYRATGRRPHPPRWPSSCAPHPAPPPAAARPTVPRADTRHPERGGAIYRWRTWTVEPVLGLLTDLLGFRPGSLRGVRAAAGAWCLVGLAFNLTRRHTVPLGSGGLLRRCGTEPGVHSGAQRPNGQTRLIHHDALGYEHGGFLGHMVDYGRG